MKIRLLVAFACLAPLLLRAELSPSAYEAMQNKAPEHLKIEVLRVEVDPGENPLQQKIHLVALVDDVTRTASDIKPKDIINILYTMADHPKGWVGPGEIPIPVEKDQSVAYLIKSTEGDFSPAAGRMSFSNF